MMEKLGQAKTHLELKKMIAEVDTTNSGSFNNDNNNNNNNRFKTESKKSTIYSLLLHPKKKHRSIYIKWLCFAEVFKMNIIVFSHLKPFTL